ncbi:MAG: M16 family metallopeptidase [Gemmatimonadaceae bacterium]
MSADRRPGAGTPRLYNFPDFVQTTLPNGLRIVAAPFHRLPIVTIRIVVDAGAVSDAPDRYGEAYLTGNGLLEGSSNYSALQIASAIEELGGELSPDIDWNDTSIAVTVRSTDMRRALTVLADILHAPVFPEFGIARLRAEQIAELQQAQRDPRRQADDAFVRALYTPGSRFAFPEDGEIEVVRSLDVSAVRDVHARRYHPANTTVVVAGAVPPDDAVQAVADSLGSWRSPAAGRLEGTPVDRVVPLYGLHLVDRPGAPQTELRLGHGGLPRLHADYYAVSVMNAILGGLFNSRINMNLRETHGYTYGAFSSFDWRVDTGPFMVSAAVQTEVTGAAGREVISEIHRIRESLVSDTECDRATAYLAGVFPIRYETTAAIAAGLAAMRVFNLPADNFERYRDLIRSVTAAQVLDAAQRHLHPDKLQVVALGDRAAIESQLSGLAVRVRCCE